MLPHTVKMVCTLQVKSVGLTVEVLFFLVLELDLLVDSVTGCMGCRSSVLLLFAIRGYADVFGF
jgi:hypothetical protein